MNATENYTLEQAINVMRNSQRKSDPFSIKFKKLSGGTSIIRKAELRPMAKSSKLHNAKYKLQLKNQETDELKSCYIPLIMEVNGIKVTI